jgi:carboxypeptidase C (cathepsin A)
LYGRGETWRDFMLRYHAKLLVRATESWELSVEEADKMKSLLKNYTYAEVSNSDHMVHVDNPEEFYKVFDGFLQTIG